MKGLTIRATDGEIGMVDQFYFDDESWTIRYLVVDVGGWLSGLSGRLVLISPYSLGSTDWHARCLNVRLTKKQVKDSPEIDTHKPVSRQREAVLSSYYGYPFYWNGPYLWGGQLSPTEASGLEIKVREEAACEQQQNGDDSRLRSTSEVKGYHVEATDGEIGHVKGFVVDDETWAIRYIEVSTLNWWPGKHVLLPPAWIKSVSWADAKVLVELDRATIQSSPEYDESAPIRREYEDELYRHYGWQPYWLHEAGHTATRA
jgi:uncharacterized protein YrrD